jgi:hypothetical protein
MLLNRLITMTPSSAFDRTSQISIDLSLDVTRVDLSQVDASSGDSAVIFGERGGESSTLKSLFLRSAGLYLRMASGQSIVRRYVKPSN